MYAPSELLQQVKKQSLSEFKDQITYFEWWNEDEYTTIMIEIRQIAWQIPVGDRIRQITGAIIGHPDACEYIIAISVSPIESVGASDDLFTLTYHGGINVFFIHYYPPERPRANPFVLSFFYTRMFKAIRTIRLDSPARLWEHLIRPADDDDAKQEAVLSFRKDLLAKELRDFLLKHLDFIKHVAAATKKPLQILEPVPIPRQPIRETVQKPPYAPKVRQMALPVGVAT